MEIGVHNGAAWIVSATGITPAGSSTSRQVVLNTNQFGPMAVTNIGGISWVTSVPGQITSTINSVKLLPNLVESSALLKVTSARTEKMLWQIIDEHGKVVMSFERIALAGQNDIQLQLAELSSGIYTLKGMTGKGAIIARFVKQ
jgi:hypothetical protein